MGRIGKPGERALPRGRGAILLGVQSLWEGVDFPGEALEILVVAKLPFSVPDDPLVEARGERCADKGLDPFRDDALPEAVLRFRQGVGRLIRRSDDRGVLVVCDPRLHGASYRRAFLAALPVTPSPIADAQELAAAAASFLVARDPEAEPVAEARDRGGRATADPGRRGDGGARRHGVRLARGVRERMEASRAVVERRGA